MSSARREQWPGTPYPLGATFDGVGTNLSLYSEVADAVEVCLFDASGEEERIELQEMTGYCWHGYLPRLGPGQRYGFRVHGPHDPSAGLRCNPAKLLLDPYAKEVAGEVLWDPALYPYPLGGDDRTRDDADSAPFMPKAVVTSPYFEWGDDHLLRTPWHQTVLYETHVRGFSMLCPEVPEMLRGTYAGLAHPAAVDHLQRLGVTAVELMPVHQFVHDQRLAERGLRNYWGYNSIAFLAPHAGYASSSSPGEVVSEFRYLVKTLHAAGIEVILDVVYNHTAEGNHLGPMLSLKGIDNRVYYRLTEPDRRHYLDTTGTGNTLNMRHPFVLKLVVDSLRYWVTEMHVDGFRFDLAATLARQFYEVDRLSAFFDLIQCDPVISQVKLIAEPWDLGSGGYQVGNFPTLWSEWNGRYRDTVRDFWRGAEGTLADLAYRITGSSDLYQHTGRRPYASINFVTAHDGFTLADLVSYDRKHNEANLEDNRDGTDDNRSWNCGAEGPTDDAEINALRMRQRRNLLVTLLLSHGVPMMCGGDEMGRTQGGNNNAYCQDNRISWYDWEGADGDLLELSRRVIALRRTHPVFHRRRFFQGRPILGTGLGDIGWFRPDGREMTDDDWRDPAARVIGVFLNGDEIPEPDPQGRRVVDDTFFIILNAYWEAIEFRLPGSRWGGRWSVELDNARADVTGDRATYQADGVVRVEARSGVVLKRG
jgi:isoamylase